MGTRRILSKREVILVLKIQQNESNVVDPEEGNPSEGSIDEPKKILESLDAEMPSRESSGKNSKRFVFSFGRAHQMAHQNAHRKHRLFHPSHFQYFMKISREWIKRDMISITQKMP